MKSESINQYITMAANIGVLMGIIFLALELQQNNELLAHGSRYSMLQNQKDWSQYLNGDEEISRLMYLDASRHNLSDLDNVRRFNILFGNLSAWQWEWEQSRSGLFGEKELPVEVFRALWRNFVIERDWPELSKIFKPDFVIFIENEVSN
jgi:hypothetical protein